MNDTFAKKLMSTVNGVVAYARKVAGLPLLQGKAMSDLRGCRIQLAQRGLTLWVPKRDSKGEIVTDQDKATGTFFAAAYVKTLNDRTVTRRYIRQDAWEVMTRDFGRRLPGIAGNEIYKIASSEKSFREWFDKVDQSAQPEATDSVATDPENADSESADLES